MIVARAAALRRVPKYIQGTSRAFCQADVLLDARGADLFGTESRRHEVRHLRAHPASCIEACEQVAPRHPVLEYRLQRVKAALHLLRSLERKIIGRYRDDH